MASFPHRHLLFSCLLAYLFLLPSCTEEKTNTSANSGTPSTTSPTPPPQEKESVSMVPTGPKNFDQLVTQLITEVIDEDYKETKMDLMDQLPRFNEANQTLFHRFQKRKPVGTKIGKLFPRFTLKSYRFATEATADKTATTWLNQFDSSADSIQLGEPVKAVKSPPLFCALREESFFILQTACLYQHPSQDSLKADFFAWMEDTGGRMGWEISCKAGELTYIFQNDL